MGIENLKTWHWIVMGAIAGLLVGYAATLAGPERDPALRHPLTNEQFGTLLSQSLSEGFLLKDLTIHPPRDGQNLVTATIDDHGFAFYASRPFPDGRAQAASVREYIDQLNARGAKIAYDYRW